jgi:hypothetical protein
MSIYHEQLSFSGQDNQRIAVPEKPATSPRIEGETPEERDERIWSATTTGAAIARPALGATVEIAPIHELTN